LPPSAGTDFSAAEKHGRQNDGDGRTRKITLIILCTVMEIYYSPKRIMLTLARAQGGGLVQGEDKITGVPTFLPL
jgi:hypothetical protein